MIKSCLDSGERADHASLLEEPGADKTKGVKRRLEAADSFDAQLDCLMNQEYKDDAECNIARYQKRYKREKDFMTTFLRQKGGTS